MAFDPTEWDDPFKLEEAYKGIDRRVLAFTDDLMLVYYTVEEGAVFPEHEHNETHQAVYIIDGSNSSGTSRPFSRPATRSSSDPASVTGSAAGASERN